MSYLVQDWSWKLVGENKEILPLFLLILFYMGSGQHDFKKKKEKKEREKLLLIYSSLVYLYILCISFHFYVFITAICVNNQHARSEGQVVDQKGRFTVTFDNLVPAKVTTSIYIFLSYEFYS